MNFDLPESHREIQRSVRDFCLRHVAPNARRWDEEERFPSELIPHLAELGLLGIRIPEAYGGSGLDTLAYAMIVEDGVVTTLNVEDTPGKADVSGADALMKQL